MAIVFPASPSVNDTFTAGSITYKWDGAKWIGLGVTPADRLVEGSNSLEINAGNDLVWTGDRVGLNTSSPEAKLEVRDTGAQGVIIRSENTQSTNTNKALRVRNNSADNTFWVSHKGFTQITINDDSDYSTNTTNTSNTTNTVLTLSNQNGSDGTGVNNYVGINFSVANGATSTAQLQYVRTGDNAGKFEFKARNTATSYPNIMTLLSDGRVGIRTEPTNNAALDIMQGYYSIMYGATNGPNGSRSDNTNKEGRIVQYHRDNEEEPLGAIVTFSQSTAGSVYIGGGSSLVNAATETALFAAANTTTTGGTKILSATIDGVVIDNDLTVDQAATGVSGVGTSTVSNVVVVGARSRVNLHQTTAPTSPTWYLHIARNGSNRTTGTVEILQHGELGGQQTGNGANYYKALWSSFNYIGDGSISSVITDNVDAGGNTSRGITGVTVSQTDEEIIYAINSNWYGTIDVIVEWMGGNIQYQLDQTSTTVF